MNIEEQIAALQAKLAEERKEKAAARLAAWDAIPRTFEYRIVAQDQFYFDIECRADADFLRRIADFEAVWGDAPRRDSYSAQWDDWRGMTYLVIEGHIVRIGGGSVILRFPEQGEYSFYSKVHVMSPDERADFAQGIVPLHWRKPW